MSGLVGGGLPFESDAMGERLTMGLDLDRPYALRWKLLAGVPLGAINGGCEGGSVESVSKFKYLPG
jgi:hypothetical protein